MFHLLNAFYIDLGIDLGTANTVVFAKKKGFIINEASCIALNEDSKPVAFGNEAKKMMGKTTSDIRVIRPLKDGVISDFEAGDELIQGLIRAAKIPRYRIGRVVMGIPTGVTEVEKKAMIYSAKAAGAKEVYLIAEPMAAAIGLDLDVKGDQANMIVDIGGGTTDIAVINYGGIVVDNTIRIAGDELNQRIMNFFRMKYRIRIGELTAEKLKIQYATLLNESGHKTFTIRFLNQISGSMQTYKFPFSLFREAFREEINSIITAILHVLETLPPELTSDIIDRGIILTGGGSLLKGLDTFIREKTELHVTIPDNPLLSVAMGIKTILEDFKYYRDILMRGQIRNSSIFA